jgi:predicted lipase
VALLISTANVILIGVCGTRFAYDWSINLAVRKRAIKDYDEIFVHNGFRSESMALSVLIESWLGENIKQQRGQSLTTYTSGNSLGGAIAALLFDLEFHNGDRLHYSRGDVGGCYIFASPKMGDVDSLSRMPQLYAIRTEPMVIGKRPSIPSAATEIA